ncbi:Oar protein [Dyella jiangningensis]|uniref:TonB-dependent receptor n=1 Tax=Dyella jiangningensis TaxID=1379159 RepID=UPI000456509D|nr:TonB-dependent receptor [Dyella jiangningensis]AHX12307.1 Oar protein [Dyella jiangningensis]MDG2537197.1 carboxypeptidase regulatory-like domain-containing protein [Dyella jiangningensis]
MNNALRSKLLPVAIATLLATAPAMAQDTSSSISGRVVDANGQPVAGATVQIVHAPSGTTKSTTTDASGRYSAQGLRVGGPFDVKVSKDGTQSEQDNVYLQLATDTAVNVTMGAAQQAATNLGAVTVTGLVAAQTFNADNKGLSTNVSGRDLKMVPTPSRSIQDVARLDPRITITDRGDGSISAMGMNSRYNKISVDGVGVGDPFGLNSNGMPYLGSPVSVDTIAEYNLSTANFDTTSDTVGADINAVTKSGTNEFHGSAYYAYRNADSMVGNAGWIKSGDRSYQGYDRDWTGGVTLGGPIIKDKLFFFASYEKQKTVGLGNDSANGLDTTLTGPSTSNKVSPGDLQRIINAANKLGLHPGDFSGGGVDLDSKRSLVKLDWNITDNHRSSFAYQRTKETQPVIQGNSNNAIGLTSYWYTKNSDTKNYSLQFFDDWNDIFSTETKIGYKDFSQVRSVPWQQPQVFINLGKDNNGKLNGASPFVDLGEDQYSDYNQISTKTTSIFSAATLYLGDHTVKGGIDFQQDKIYNLFGRTQFGAYTFWGIDNFEKGIYNQFDLYQPAKGYSLDDVAGKWTLRRYSFFLQDNWQVTERLAVLYGFRVNRYSTDDKPVYNPTFEKTFGFRNDQTIDGSTMVEPRVSFNYAFNTELQTQLRGGVGLFQSNPPTVWMTNPYQNNGMTVATYSIRNSGNLPVGPGTIYPGFSPDPFNQNVPPPSNTQMAVDTVAPNFKLPSVWKSSLAIDRELPWMGLIATAEYEHIKVRDAIWYQNLNIGAPTGVLPDGRYTYYKNIYGGPTGNTNRANANNKFSVNTTELANTGKGYSDALTLSLKKPFADEWSASLGVTFSNAREVNPGTSSQASSNFSNNVWVNPNENVDSIANYATSRRVMASVAWSHAFFGNYATTISAFYNGQTGQPYSWVFANDANGDSYSRDLAYIPKQGDVLFQKGTSQAAIDQFYAFIKQDSYLKDHQGEIAKRNATRAAWTNQLDMSFSQEVPGLFKGNKGEIRLDVYNFLNLLNNDWGQQLYVPFPYTRNLASFQGVDKATGKYIYSLPTDANGNYQPGTKVVYDAGRDIKTNVVSRWSAMLTLRYTF